MLNWLVWFFIVLQLKCCWRRCRRCPRPRRRRRRKFTLVSLFCLTILTLLLSLHIECFCAKPSGSIWCAPFIFLQLQF